MNVITKILITVLLTLSFGLQPASLQAQDIHFSQFTMTPLQLDPSQAGKFSGDTRAIINYRDQWSSITSNSFKTYGGSFDMPFSGKSRKKNFFGGGIAAYSDKAGAVSLGTTVFNLSLAYHIKIKRSSYLSLGLQGGFLQRSLNTSNIRSGKQFDGAGHNPESSSGEVFQNTSFLKPDFSAGISFTHGDNTTHQVMSDNGFDGKKINVGAVIHHVASPEYSFLEDNSNQLNFRYLLHANTSFGVRGTNVAIQPSGFIAYQQKAIDFVIGSYFRYTLKEKSKYTKFSNGAAFNIGLHYRVGDAFIPSILLEMGSLAIGISYDVNFSGLSAASSGRGGYELSIRYITPNPFGKRKSQARFF